MPRLHLTERTVRYLSTDKTQEDVYDSVVGGFGVRLTRRGRKTFFVRYRSRGRNRRMALGHYPAVALAEAREVARAFLADVSRGTDPQDQRAVPLAREQPVLTFGALANQFLEKYSKINRKSWREDERIVRHDLVPGLGVWAAADLKRSDVLRVLEGIVDRGAPVMANRVLTLIKRIFNWGLERDLVPRNPVAGMRRLSPEKPRERVLNEAEIAMLWREFDEEQTVISLALKLLLLTAQRTIEVLSMRWEDIQDGVVWVIPSDVTKSRRTHSVPLAPTVQSLLQRTDRSQTGWVLPSPKKRGARLHDTSLSHVARRIRDRLDLEWRCHDLRRTAASHMTAMGIRRFLVGRILNHSDRTVTAIYDRHSYLPEMRQALVAWAERVEQIVTPPAISDSDRQAEIAGGAR